MINFEEYAGALSELYLHKATIYTVEDAQAFEGASPHLKQQKQSEVALYTDIPCYVEYETHNPTTGEPIPEINQRITLVCASEYKIPEGARIVVDKFGDVQTFYSAGLADRVGSHQEITLNLERSARS